MIENLFDRQYGIYGTYLNTELAQEAGPGEDGTGGPDPSLDGLEYDEDNARRRRRPSRSQRTAA